jgi:hypothetical protein
MNILGTESGMPALILLVWGVLIAVSLWEQSILASAIIIYIALVGAIAMVYSNHRSTTLP